MLRASLCRWAAPMLFCVCAGAQTPGAQTPIGELFSSDPGSPAVAQTAGTGMTVLSGSEVSAGIAPATLKLARGGELRICPKSQLTVNSAGQGLMLGMGAGALEINYQVESSAADLVVTPDLNIRLAGPGAYHFALGVSARGDTCFKPLRGNTAGIVFSELLGSDELAVAADETAFFPEGKLAGRTTSSRPCGCPVPAPAMHAGEQPQAPSHPQESHPAEHVVEANHEITMPARPEQPGQTHSEVETPFVFSAKTSALPGQVARLEFATLPNMFFAQEDVDPVVLPIKPPEAPAKDAPAKDAKPESTPAAKKENKDKKGFMAGIKGFFGSIFHH